MCLPLTFMNQRRGGEDNTMRGVEEEAAVIGAILTQGSCYQDAASILELNYFYKEEHRLIWKAMTALFNDGKKIDAITVASRLKEHKCLTKAGGQSGIASMMDILFDTSNVKEYAKQVRSAYIGRGIKGLGRKLMMDDVSPEDRMDYAFSKLTEYNRKAALNREIKVGKVSEEIVSAVVDGNGFDSGIPTGFKELDEPLSGLKKEDFIILAARPSIGKSAFSLQVAAEIAQRGMSVLYVSPEMSQKQLTYRLLSLMSGVPYMKLIKQAGLTKNEIEMIKDAGNKIINLPLVIDDSSEQTISSIRPLARRHASPPNTLDLIMVDYLQLLCPGDDSKEAVTKISKGLKALAKDLDIPVWGVSQLSRSIIYRDSKRPVATDLRGSGQLEQDADVILMMWRPRSTEDKVEVFIEKHRNGPLGTVTLDFDPDTTKFTTGGW